MRLDADGRVRHKRRFPHVLHILSQIIFSMDNTTNNGTIKDVVLIKKKFVGTKEKEKSVRWLILTRTVKQIIRQFCLAGFPHTGNENFLRHFDRKFKTLRYILE